MVYAKRYPSTLVEEYRKTVRATYADFHGADALRVPTLEEWREFSASCNQRINSALRCADELSDDVAAALEAVG